MNHDNELSIAYQVLQSMKAGKWSNPEKPKGPQSYFHTRIVVSQIQDIYKNVKKWYRMKYGWISMNSIPDCRG